MKSVLRLFIAIATICSLPLQAQDSSESSSDIANKSWHRQDKSFVIVPGANKREIERLVRELLNENDEKSQKLNKSESSESTSR